MSRLSFVADEHVKREYVHALRANGVEIAGAGGEYETGTDDFELVERARDARAVILTTDADFVELADEQHHTGIVLYQQYGHPAHDIVRAIDRIDRYFAPAEFHDHVEWLENWL